MTTTGTAVRQSGAPNLASAVMLQVAVAVMIVSVLAGGAHVSVTLANQSMVQGSRDPLRVLIAVYLLLGVLTPLLWWVARRWPLAPALAAVFMVWPATSQPFGPLPLPPAWMPYAMGIELMYYPVTAGILIGAAVAGRVSRRGRARGPAGRAESAVD